MGGDSSPRGWRPEDKSWLGREEGMELGDQAWRPARAAGLLLQLLAPRTAPAHQEWARNAERRAIK